MKVVAIVQARMGSTRLPGKVLLPAAGEPLIVHMMRRVKRCRTFDALWLATSVQPQDDRLDEVVRTAGFGVFRGSEEDVLSRYAEIARRENADLVVRLTGDCPLHDPTVIDEIVAFASAHVSEFDYVSNALIPSYPDGLDVEVCTRAALDEAHARAVSPVHREHVTPFIHRFKEGAGSYRVHHFRGVADFSHLRWTLDEPADYEFIRQVYDRLFPIMPDFGWFDVIALLTSSPELLAINRHITRNENVDPMSFAGGSLTLRPARLEDAAAVWALANDPLVAANRFSSGDIPLDAHRAWFQQRLESASTRMWVLAGSDGIAGQVRYDCTEDGLAEIDYWIAPSHRGLGLGPALLRRTWHRACRALGVSGARGIVFDSNRPSKRAFEKSGFAQVCKRSIGGRVCVIFERRLSLCEPARDASSRGGQ